MVEGVTVPDSGAEPKMGPFWVMSGGIVICAVASGQGVSPGFVQLWPDMV